MSETQIKHPKEDPQAEKLKEGEQYTHSSSLRTDKQNDICSETGTQTIIYQDTYRETKTDIDR